MTELFAILTQLTGQSEEIWRQGFAIFLRLGALAALLPGFGEAAVPQRVKLGLALAFTLVVAPGVEVPALTLGGYGAEVVVGLALGLGLRLLVLALQTAGAMIANATSLSQILGGAGEPQPAIGHLLTMGGLALAMAADLHLRVAEFLILSYRLFPVGLLPDSGGMAEWGTAQVAQAFHLAFVLAAPFVAGSLIYNVAIGIINRAMPQLMVSMIGAPALGLGVLILLAILTPLVLTVWLSHLNGWLERPFG
ncbi:flagellar biosynthetic protein FliR [Falsirhodobacter sp. 20TX0035]|uniref:flagellar biosynthetic protein FliR n=1 Tax=Falsirhodobacter sp. 20TX0035 TaxID=3022019 RepID=UPI00232BD34A|nr:flagellar biosynthetic protein FliR [Falsirhodobacter sp. 20TX0035]MDB6452479.1 flagellar biosynthetic protein FliR [Falsirhodobacter sp. 20TX0035]